MKPVFHATTILGVRKGATVAIGGDGQVTFDDYIMKEKALKVRKLYDDKVIAGFAGAAADAFALFEKFEKSIDQWSGNLPRAAVELAKEWRTDKYLRQLEALLVVGDKDNMLIISGTGDVIEPDDNIVAIGSGGPYALAAARALVKYSDLDAKSLVKESLKIASKICIYTNDKITVQVL